jgi:hypothetical protein
MNNVFCVSYGEQCEGGSVVAVFHTLASARAYVTKTYLTPSAWFEPSADRKNYWTDGVDYVHIVMWKVRP